MACDRFLSQDLVDLSVSILLQDINVAVVHIVDRLFVDLGPLRLKRSRVDLLLDIVCLERALEVIRRELVLRDGGSVRILVVNHKVVGLSFQLL